MTHETRVIQQMTAALLDAEIAVEQLCADQDVDNECWRTLRTIREALIARDQLSLDLDASR